MSESQPDTFPLESRPSPEQRQRLEDWLTELLMISRRYRIVLFQDTGRDLQFIDTDRDTLIGLDLELIRTVDGRISEYLPADSILDGVWFVDSDAGPVEQRTLGSLLPVREDPEPL